MAEAHPVGFRFVMKAREKGARVIHVDPHFSRTSACATDYVPIRTGTDIVFLGGIINQILQQERWFKEYVLHYTNAATIINDKYVDAEDADGIFSGFDPETGEYEIAQGQLAIRRDEPPAAADCTRRGTTTQVVEPNLSRARGRQAGARPHAAAPQLRAEHPAAALRPLHA